MSGLGELRELSRSATWRRWALASTFGRLPGTMSVLAYVLVGEEIYGSIATGALLAGAATFSAGIAAPAIGRVLDRRGLRRGLDRSLSLTALVLCAQLLVVALAGPVWLLLCLAVLQGIGYAAIPGAYRALLVPSVRPEDLPRANTVDAVLTEVGFIAGPVVATVAGALTGPLGVVGAMFAVVVVAAAQTRRHPPVHPSLAGARAPWRRGSAAVVYAVAFAVGISIGLLESALAARVVEFGQEPEAAGVHLTLVALGSGLSGLVVSTLQDQRGRMARRALIGLLGFAATLTLAAEAPGPVLLGVAMVGVGIPIAPLNALGAQRLQDTLDARQHGEGFALYAALILVGVGTGDLLTGRLLDLVGPAALLELAGMVPLGVAAVFGAVVLGRSRGRRVDPARRP